MIGRYRHSSRGLWPVRPESPRPADTTEWGGASEEPHQRAAMERGAVTMVMSCRIARCLPTDRLVM